MDLHELNLLTAVDRLVLVEQINIQNKLYTTVL